MAKQTFTTGQVLTAAQMTQLQQTAMLGGDANARTASYVLVAGDAGNAVTMSSTSATTITVNNGIFAAGDIVTIVNINTGVCTITAGTATVTTSGSLALAANQGGVLRFTSSSAAIFLQFATPASGDIEGITTGANSGLTGGVTSGTADLKVNFASKGQLAVGTGSGTTGFLNVGTNGYTIVADSAEATGLKWATPSSGIATLVGCKVVLTSNYTLANNTETALAFTTELFDTDSFHDNSTNTSRITIPSGKSGYYILNASMGIGAVTSGQCDMRIRKNGAQIGYYPMGQNATNHSSTAADVFYLSAGDYVELVGFQDSGGSKTVYGGTGSSQSTYFSAILIGV